MPAYLEVIEFEVIPIPPDTVASTQDKVKSFIATTLREASIEQLLDNGEIRIESERTFPDHETIRFIVELFTPVASEVFAHQIWPRIIKAFSAERKPSTPEDEEAKGGANASQRVEER